MTHRYAIGHARILEMRGRPAHQHPRVAGPSRGPSSACPTTAAPSSTGCAHPTRPSSASVDKIDLSPSTVEKSDADSASTRSASPTPPAAS